MKMNKDDIKKTVRQRYAEAAKSAAPCCGPSPCGCGEAGQNEPAVSQNIDYSKEDLANIPGESDLGLGCGNPTAVAGLKKGEVVLDLGAGGGIDCFLASKKVGPSGRVIGVDMTPEMVERARENARRNGYINVEFRLGEIESLPVADGSVDVIISNCVINLSPEKDRVFAELFRVLRPGGRFSISDIVAEPMPGWIKKLAPLYSACITGAIPETEYLAGLRKAGLVDVAVSDRIPYDGSQLEAMLDSEAAGSCGCGPENLSKKQAKRAADALAGKVASLRVVGRKSK